AAESEYARRYKPVGMVDIDADAKTLAERNQTEQQQSQAPEAEEYSGPGHYFGLEEPLGADEGEIECSGKHGVEIEQSERRNQEVRPVYSAKMHRPCSCSSHQHNPGQHHSE